MTPAQLAKDFAAANGFTIQPVGRRYAVLTLDGNEIANVGGYLVALKAMQRYVADAESIAWHELNARGVPMDQPDVCVEANEFVLALVMDLSITGKDDVAIYHGAINTVQTGKVREPWSLFAGTYKVGSYGSRADAVKASRQIYNASRRAGLPGIVHSITYVGV